MVKISKHITASLQQLSPAYLQLIIRTLDKAERLYANEELFLCFADKLDYSNIMSNPSKIGYTHKDMYGRQEPTIYINSLHKKKIFTSRNKRDGHFVSITTFMKWVGYELLRMATSPNWIINADDKAYSTISR